MSTNYAQILTAKYRSHEGGSMQAEIDLAYSVIDVLDSSTEVTQPWSKLKRKASGLIKTRARRSKAQFHLAFKEAIKLSEVEEINTPPPVLTNIDREKAFEYRLANPNAFRRKTLASKTITVAPEVKKDIILEETNYRDREHEFKQRLSSPSRFRRSN